MLLLIVILGVFKTAGYKKSQGYDPNDDRFLFHSESAVYYHYAKLFAGGEKFPVLDKALQAPEGLNPSREFTLVMEWTAGALYRFWGSTVPFHGFIIFFNCFFSSLTISAAWLLSLRNTGSPRIALLTALIYGTAYPAYIRTMGGFLSENFALPLLFLGFACHVWGLTGAASEKKGIMLPLSGIFLALAVSSWHFSQFVILVIVLWRWFELLVSGRRPGSLAGLTWIYMFLFTAGILSFPLAEKYFIVSSLMLLLPAYLLASFFPLLRIPLFIAALVSGPVSGILLPEHYSDFKHVYMAFWQKLTHLGIKPVDPGEISFESRVFWAGPFDVPLPSRIVSGFLIFLLIAVTFAVKSISIYLKKNEGLRNAFNSFREGDFRRSLPESGSFLIFCTFVFTPIYLLNARFCVFLIFFASQLVGFALSKSRGRFIPVLTVCLLLFQIHEMSAVLITDLTPIRLKLSKVLDPGNPLRLNRTRGDTRDIYKWINSVESDEIMLADPAFSADIFNDTGCRTSLHPMFEKSEIRERTAWFYRALYGSIDDFEEFCNIHRVDYFIYEADFLLESSTASSRYFGDSGPVDEMMPAFLFHFAPEKCALFRLEFENNYFRVYKYDPGKIGDDTLASSHYRPIFDKTLFSLNKFDSDAAAFIKGYNRALGFLTIAARKVAAGKTSEAMQLLEAASEYFPEDPVLIRFMEKERKNHRATDIKPIWRN